MHKIDYVIFGAGVVGAAIAWAVLKTRPSVRKASLGGDADTVRPRVKSVEPELLSPGGPAHKALEMDDGPRQVAPHDLKGKATRGAFVSTFSQGGKFILRMGSMFVLARLLSPQDFGLVGMATAWTGFLALFRDAGLSMATIQRATISHSQTSMLFWVNLAVGGTLAALCVALAPFLTAFYHEPRLFWVTVATGTGFLFNGAATQHRAVLERGMRFTTLAIIDIVSMMASIAVGIGMALAGFGYESLVGMAITMPVVSAIHSCLAGGWLPELPRRGVAIRSMIRDGGTVTITNIINYFAYNVDKVLIGRFWGAEALGIYGRAYQLINIPTENFNWTLGTVGFAALSRLQHEPERLKTFFLKGYGLFLSLVLPITMACALFADDIIRVFLGSKWYAAVPLFKFMAPLILALAMINPLGWVQLAIGRASRNFKISLLAGPVVVLGYLAGINAGTEGVAAGGSVATGLLVIPIVIWSTRGLPWTAIDTLKVIMRPLVAILVAAGLTLAVWHFISLVNIPLIRLIVANLVLFSVYAFVLCFVMGQKDLYAGLLRDLGILPLGKR